MRHAASELNGLPPSVVRIALAADERFAPCETVVLRSLEDVASSSRQYEIFFLHAGLRDETRAAVARTVTRPNVRLSFVDVRPCPGYRELLKTDFSGARVPPESFFRLLLPELLPDVGRILYLDGDLLLRRDPAALFDLDLGDALVAGVMDAPIFHALRTWSGYAAALESIGMTRPQAYFNAGVLILDLARFRAENLWPRLRALVSTAVRYHCDQDILNVVCQGRVRWLDARWNALLSGGEGTVLAPTAWIIHYNGWIKPWQAAVPFGEAWHRVAARTPFAAAFATLQSVPEETVSPDGIPQTLKRQRVFAATIGTGGVKVAVDRSLETLWRRRDVWVPVRRRRAKTPERTLLYWMWKHPEAWDNPGHVGRIRNLRLAKRLGLTAEGLRAACAETDMILVRRERASVSAGQAESETLASVVKTAADVYPCYRAELEAYGQGRVRICSEAFVVRRNVFFSACNFVFDVCAALASPSPAEAGFLFGFYLHHLSRLPDVRCRELALSSGIGDLI